MYGKRISSKTLLYSLVIFYFLKLFSIWLLFWLLQNIFWLLFGYFCAFLWLLRSGPMWPHCKQGITEYPGERECPNDRCKNDGNLSVFECQPTQNKRALISAVLRPVGAYKVGRSGIGIWISPPPASLCCHSKTCPTWIGPLFACLRPPISRRRRRACRRWRLTPCRGGWDHRRISPRWKGIRERWTGILRDCCKSERSVSHSVTLSRVNTHRFGSGGFVMLLKQIFSCRFRSEREEKYKRWIESKIKGKRLKKNKAAKDATH